MTTQYVRYPSAGGSGSVPTYANFASLPASATDGAQAITLDTYILYVFEIGSMTWIAQASPGTALSIGVINSEVPSANGAVLDMGALVLQSASATVPGLVDNTTQILSGNKTLSGTTTLSGLTASLPLVLDASKHITSVAIALASQVSGILPVANGGTNLASGTSGGVLAYTASGTLASSALLTAHALVLGGGSGAVPSTPVGLGTTTTLLHGNASGDPSYSAVVLTTDVSGTLPSGNGGTGLAVVGTSGNVLTSNGSAWVSSAPATSGTVTSVGLALPADFTISNSPVTSSGTLTAVWASVTQNKFLASPNGSSGTPTFRAIVAADVPTLNQNTTGTALNITASSNSSLTTLSSLSLPASQLTGTLAAGQFPALTGDVTTSAGSLATTLASVATAGTTGSSTSIPAVTINVKGLVTSITGNAVIAPAGTLSGTTLASNVVTSSLTSVGTIATGVWQGTAVATGFGGTGLSSSGTSGNVLTSNGSAWVSQAANSTIAVTSQTTTYAIAANDALILLSSAGGAYSATLPTAVGITGKIYKIKKTDTVTNLITLATTSAQTIDGFASVTLFTQGEQWEVVSDGTNWQVLEHYIPGNWVTYTPTYTGFGTVTTTNFWWRRVGDSMELAGRFTCGTTTATEGRVSLPSGYTSESSAKITTRSGGYHMRGAAATAHGGAMLIEQSVTYIVLTSTGTYSNTSINALNAVNGNSNYVSGEELSIEAKIPIVNWYG